MKLYPKIVLPIALLLSVSGLRFGFIGAIVWPISVIVTMACLIDLGLWHKRRQWRVFNVILRILGAWLLMSGLVFFGWAIYFVIEPVAASKPVHRGEPVLSFVVAALFSGLGSLFLRCPAYRPDLGDSLLSDRATSLIFGLPRNWRRPKVLGRESRTWWTGDSRQNNSGAA